MGNCAVGYGPMNSTYHTDDSVLSSRQLTVPAEKLNSTAVQMLLDHRRHMSELNFIENQHSRFIKDLISAFSLKVRKQKCPLCYNCLPSTSLL